MRFERKRGDQDGTSTHSRGYDALNHPTWGSVLVSAALVAAVPVLLWIGSRPLAGAVGLGTVGGLAVVAPPAYRLARCASRCRRFAIDVGDSVRITVTKPPADESC